MSQWALAWCLKTPAVSAVIPGCKSPAQVEANAAAAEHPRVLRLSLLPIFLRTGEREVARLRSHTAAASWTELHGAIDAGRIGWRLAAEQSKRNTTILTARS